MLSLILRFIRRENPELERAKEWSAQEKQASLNHVNGLKAQLAELNGKKGHGPKRG